MSDTPIDPTTLTNARLTAKLRSLVDNMSMGTAPVIGHIQACLEALHQQDEVNAHDDFRRIIRLLAGLLITGGISAPGLINIFTMILQTVAAAKAKAEVTAGEAGLPDGEQPWGLGVTFSGQEIPENNSQEAKRAALAASTLVMTICSQQLTPEAIANHILQHEAKLLAMPTERPGNPAAN